jgi:cell division protein FtsW (lipid II flippase)
MTPLRVSIIASVAAVVMLVVIFELIRRRHLRERYALIWVVTGIVLLVLALWRGGLNTLARWVGVKTYPPSVLFAALLFFMLVLVLHFSIVLSRLTDQNVTLAQKLALLEARLREREQADENAGS